MMKEFNKGFMKKAGGLCAILIFLIVCLFGGWYLFKSQIPEMPELPEAPCIISSKCETKTMIFIKNKLRITKEKLKDDSDELVE